MTSKKESLAPSLLHAQPASMLHSQPGRETAQMLVKKIFDSDVPEQFIRTVPAQSIYQIIQEYGVLEISDVVEIITREQFQTLLDLDLWHGDRFEESQLWAWLGLPEATESLISLQRLLGSMDLKLVALLIARHVLIFRTEEATDSPPAPEYYTPDKGHTWLLANHPDENNSFLINRLLALIFETNPELFYQLISIPDVATQSQLEEESYEERQKRLLKEGIPDREWANELHTPLNPSEALRLLDRGIPETSIQDIHSIRPLVYQERLPEPLRSLLSELPDQEPTEMEITLLINAGIVRWSIDFSDQESSMELIRSIRGAMNIGLEFLSRERPDRSLTEIEKTLKLRKIYQTGLHLILPLRKAAYDQKKKIEKIDEMDSVTLALLEALIEPFPKLPKFIDQHGDTIESGDGKLEGGFRALEHLSEIEWARSVLDRSA